LIMQLTCCIFECQGYFIKEVLVYKYCEVEEVGREVAR